MRKILQIVAISFIMLCSVINQANADTPNTKFNKKVKIEYTNEIEGFRVSALWEPQRTFNLHILGPAVLTFTNTKNGTSFSILENDFSIMASRLPFEYSQNTEALLNIKQDKIQLSYDNNASPNDGDNFGRQDVPFFFEDVNFNGRKELVILEAGRGQRLRPAYKVYNLSSDGGLVSGHQQITNKEPFIHFDSGTIIDHINKKIKIDLSSGACSSEYKTYKPIYDTHSRQTEIVLDSVEAYYYTENNNDSDSLQGRCHLKKFKVIGKELALLSDQLVTDG